MAKSKRIQRVFVVYWFLLAYVIAALIWWYIALAYQVNEISRLRANEPGINDNKRKLINEERQRKTAQYLGEGAIFLLVIVAGAIFIYRAVRKQLHQSQQQHNFMIAITHELKTPIAVAKLNLETIQLRKLDAQQQQKLLQNTLQETNRLNDLCNNMLLSSQIEAGGYRMVREEIQLNELVKTSVHDFANRYPTRAIHLKTTDDIVVMGDGLLVQIAVNNLLENAIKYSPKTSDVNIILSKDPVIRLEISDQGPGIAGNEKKKVFEKFYRMGNEATRSSKGTGLGLYLTKRIIATHNGKIYIRDNEGGGSTFVIEFKPGSKNG